MMTPRDWWLRLERLERGAEKGWWDATAYPHDSVLADLRAIRAEVAGIEAALEGLQKRGSHATK